MTTTLTHPARPLLDPAADTRRYQAQGKRRNRLADALQVLAWLSLAAPVALWLGQGGFAQLNTVAGIVTGIGIVSGLIATASMVLMLWLTARVPVIDRAIGQDRATALHARLGQLTFGGLIAHGLFLVAGYALADKVNAVTEFVSLWAQNDFVLAVASIALLTAVSVSSVVAARKALSFEVWKGIHLLTYVAVLVGLPHQFTMGSVFAAGPAQWYWLAVWGATFFAILSFRFFRPLFSSLDHRVKVASVEFETPDVATITMTGRHLDKLGASAGQYFHWRFLAAGLW